MSKNPEPSPMGNVAPRPPPPIVRCQPLPTWYMQLGRTRPLLLNKTPFPSRTPPAAFMLPNPPIHWLAPFPAGVLLKQAVIQIGLIMMKVKKKKNLGLKNSILILNNIIIFLNNFLN